MSKKLKFSDDSKKLIFENQSTKVVFADEYNSLIFDITQGPYSNFIPYLIPHYIPMVGSGVVVTEGIGFMQIGSTFTIE